MITSDQVVLLLFTILGCVYLSASLRGRVLPCSGTLPYSMAQDKNPGTAEKRGKKQQHACNMQLRTKLTAIATYLQGE